MNAPVLVGMYGAWAAAQGAMALLFLTVFASRRRETAFLVFGCLCLSLTVTDVALARMYGAESFDDWADAANLANASVAVAAALGVHFARTFDPGEAGGRVALLGPYAVAVVFVAVALGDGWVDRTTLRLVEGGLLGFEWPQVVGRSKPMGIAFYIVVGPVYSRTMRALLRASRAGTQNVKGVVFALALGTVFVVNDILVAAAQVPSLYLTPVGFLMCGLGFALVLVDRHERAAADLEVTADELRNATDELTSSYTTLGRVQEELFRRRQLASVGELAGTIAHEVRNPLAIIRNAAASLRRPTARPEDRETLLAIVDEEIDRLNGLVTELLRFARPVDVERADVSIVDLVQGIDEELPDEYRFVVAIDDPRAETLWADPTLMRLAVDNLVTNAVQSMPEGGQVTVRVGRSVREGSTVSTISVVDSGVGMAPATLERAFDPFFTTRPKGTGLGLPIVRRVAEAHDGTVAIDSASGRGTTVTLTLPFRGDAVTRPSASRLPEVP